MKVSVLGAGLVGGPMAMDLARDNEFDVLVADIDKDALERTKKRAPNITTIESDLSDANAVKGVVAECDIVVSAVPGFMGFETLKTIVSAGKPVVDIAFFGEDPFELDGLAKSNGVVAVVDCGVAPGMSNVLVSHADTMLDSTISALIYVGGLPLVRTWPYEYKAGFSPVDVIEEYVRPARFVENGELVTRPALSDPELVDFPGLGSLEAFNTDGLRSLATTIDAPNLKEKTLRYPGHIEKMAVLRETGFFDETPIVVNGVEVKPVDFTSKLLFPKWKLEPNEVDITVMRIVVEGESSGSQKRYVYELFDKADRVTGVHSMARTTGYTATVTVRLLSAGLYSKPGITPPEFIGRDPACVEFLLSGLKDRGVEFTTPE